MLANGKKVIVKLLDLKEIARISLRNAVREG